MTVSSSTSKSRYTGNGVTTAFTGSFRILDEDHVTVTHTSTVGVDTVKTITTDYTVSGVGGSSFTVTHLAAPANGVIVTLSRNVPATQELDLVENDAMPANDLETAFDKITMLFQQVTEAVSRAIRFPVSDSSSLSAELPSASLRAGKLLRFNATTGEPEVVAIADIGTTAFATAAEMTTGTASDVMVSPKELTEWAPAAATLASADEFLVRDATDSKVKRMAASGLTALVDSASETVAGTIEIATAAETTTGTDDVRAITPLKLTTFAPATATPDTGADSVIFLDATDSKLKKGTFPSGTTYYTSADQTITSAGSLTLAHGLGARPKGYTTFLVCVTGEAGYSAGDVVVVNPHEQDSAGASSRGTSLTVDATNINVRFGSAAGAFAILNKGTGAGGTLTNGNWSWRIIAWV